MWASECLWLYIMFSSCSENRNPLTPPLTLSLRDDLVRAIKKLKAMGNGFGMIPVGGSYLVQSVPAELNMDHTVVLQLAEVINTKHKVWGRYISLMSDLIIGHVLQKKGYVTVSEIRDSLKWERERACHVLVSVQDKHLYLNAFISYIKEDLLCPFTNSWHFFTLLQHLSSRSEVIS